MADLGDQQRRDPRYPCRRCRCPGFGYELGDHPGICFCNHDDGEHGPRRSALRRWLRSIAAADNWQRFLDEMAVRDEELRRQQSENLSAAMGEPVEVGPPIGWTFPRMAMLDDRDGTPIAPNPSHPLDPDHGEQRVPRGLAAEIARLRGRLEVIRDSNRHAQFCGFSRNKHRPVACSPGCPVRIARDALDPTQRLDR